jgi:branched-chain amino acid transport system substrate-binding protein
LYGRACLVGLILFLAVPLCAAPPPYKRMLDDPLAFQGHKGEPVEVAGVEAVTIGLFLPAQDADPLARELLRGVELALEDVNRQGGYRGRPFRVVRRWAENPWGAGSKEMIRLVYEDRALAVIGYVNGIGHIAEQIAAKAYVAVLSPASADSSLTQARLPWIFRLPPNNASQAKVLVTEGIVGRGLRKLGLITSLDHDGRVAALELRSALEAGGLAPKFHLNLEPQGAEIEQVVSRIQVFAPDGLVLHLPPELLLRLLSGLQQAGFSRPLFLPWIPSLPIERVQSIYAGSLTILEPFPVSRETSFAKAYQAAFAVPASPSATYAFDAVKLIAAAVRRKGLNRSDIRDGIAEQSEFPGTSSLISWDNGGGNPGHPHLRQLQ